jgi:hypothetical protein
VLLLLLADVQQLALSAVVRTLLQGRRLVVAPQQGHQAIQSPVHVHIITCVNSISSVSARGVSASEELTL